MLSVNPVCIELMKSEDDAGSSKVSFLQDGPGLVKPVGSLLTTDPAISTPISVYPGVGMIKLSPGYLGS